MKLCIKIGGAQLENLEARVQLATSIAAAQAAGHELVVVHGGGNQIRALCARLGIEDHYHRGQRITDAATADVALQVLAGEVSKPLVQALCEGGVPAVGLCGADGGLFTARRHTPGGTDLGYVGVVDQVDPRLCVALHDAGYVPVIATLAPLDSASAGPRDRLYNINADYAAGPLARELGCDALLFLTDVPGVLDADGERLDSLTPADCEALTSAGVLRGGMVPKVESALAALRDLPGKLVKIAPAKGSNAVQAALDDAVGTRFLDTAPEGSTRG